MMHKLVKTLIRYAVIIGIVSTLFWGIVVGIFTSPLWIAFIAINTPTVLGVYLLYRYTNVSKHNNKTTLFHHKEIFNRDI